MDPNLSKKMGFDCFAWGDIS